MRPFSNNNFCRALPHRAEKLLPEELVQELLAKEKITYYQSIYTPIVTLWAMISQVLDPDKSLSQAVKRMSTWLSAAGVKSPSSDTGAYSKASSRLPEKLVQQLVPIVAEALENEVPRLTTMVWTTSAGIRWDNSIDE
ncbi:hypothetical protein QUB47_13825 [Microcoleus sp. AT9_B5]